MYDVSLLMIYRMLTIFTTFLDSFYPIIHFSPTSCTTMMMKAMYCLLVVFHLQTTQISCFFLFTDGTGILPVFLFDHSFHQLTKNEYRSLSNENPNTTNQVLHSIVFSYFWMLFSQFSKLTQPNAYVDFAVRGYRVSNQILYCLQDTEISF